MRRRYRSEQYPGLLTADPPICGPGPAATVLRRCERLAKGLTCYCRVNAGDLADDLLEAGARDIAEYFEASLEHEDVVELVADLDLLEQDGLDADLSERLRVATDQLRRIAASGSGLTDRYSDEVD
jgi:hypothetical protein